MLERQVVVGPHVGLDPCPASPSPQSYSSPSAWLWAPFVAMIVCLLVNVIVAPLIVTVVRRRRLVSFFLCVASIFFCVLLLEMASEDNNEARHMSVAKEKEEAGYEILKKAKVVVEDGSATVAYEEDKRLAVVAVDVRAEGGVVLVRGVGVLLGCLPLVVVVVGASVGCGAQGALTGKGRRAIAAVLLQGGGVQR